MREEFFSCHASIFLGSEIWDPVCKSTRHTSVRRSSCRNRLGALGSGDNTPEAGPGTIFWHVHLGGDAGAACVAGGSETRPYNPRRNFGGSHSTFLSPERSMLGDSICLIISRPVGST